MVSETMSTLENRFWKYVLPEPNSGCWLWDGTVANTGYGQIGEFVGGVRKLHYAHRLSYEMHKGPIPDGLHIDHLCRVRCCVNPAHLEAVTQRTNIMRGVSSMAIKASATHCVNGHEFTEENTYYRKDGRGHRNCKSCKRNRDRVWWRKTHADHAL